MPEIILDRAASAAFIAHAGRYTAGPALIKARGERLLIEGMAADEIAAALAFAAFPARERQRLNALARRYCRELSPSRRSVAAAVAQINAGEDIPCRPLYQGPRRLQKLAAEFLPLLIAGRLDLNGFCRFRLPGYEEYLGQLLIRAQEELLAAEEEDEYYRLLRSGLTAGRCHVALFFYPDDICQIWQRDQNGIRQLEGGHIRGVEWLVAANLIALDPITVTVNHSHQAAPDLLRLLERIFGGKLQINSRDRDGRDIAP